MNEQTSAARVHGILTAYLQSQAVFTALELEIFEQLEGKALAPREVAQQLGLDERPVRALLLALEGLELLETDGERFSNASTASRHLVQGSPDYMGGLARHQSVHFGNFDKLPSAVRSNTSVTKRVLKEGYSDQGAGVGEGAAGRKRLVGAMRESSRLQADKLARKLDLTEGSTVVDLGCGSADYSIAIAREHPDVRIISVDYPAISEIAGSNVEEAGLEKRITMQPGDIMKDPLPPCDAVLLCHVLDGYGREQTEILLRKLFSEMKPGARLFIHSHMPDVAEGLFSSLFGLILLINTETGEVYEGRELSDLVERVGFENPTIASVSFLSGLLSASKP